jgi:hypothetical protein
MPVLSDSGDADRDRRAALLPPLAVVTPRRRAGATAGRWLLALLLAAAPLALAAQTPGSEPAAAAEAAKQDAAEAPPAQSALRGQVEALYVVSSSPGGLLLEPRNSRFGVRRIEIVGADVAVNGADVPRDAFRSWLGDEAELLLRLADLPRPQQRALFGLPPVPGEPRVEEPVASGGEPAPPVDEEGGDGEATDDESQVRVRLGEDDSGTEVILAPSGAQVRGSELPRPPRPPRAPISVHRRGDEISVMRNLLIPEGESVKTAVAVMGSVRVDGEVRGDVTAVMGSVEVYGLVEGTVVAVGGSVLVGPDGEISRDATSIGGAVERRSGGTIRGSVAEVPMLGSGWSNDRGFQFDNRLLRRQHSWWSAVWGVFWWAIWVVLRSMLVSIVVLLAPRFVEQCGRKIGVEWWKSGLVGLLVLIIFLPVLVVLIVMLAITIIGIPLAVLLAILSPFLILGLWLLGAVAAARCVGNWTLARLGRSPRGEYLPVITGVVVLSSFDLVGHLFDLLAVGLGIFRIPADFFHGLGFVAWLVATVIGLGAVFMVALERRRRRGVPATGVFYPMEDHNDFQDTSSPGDDPPATGGNDESSGWDDAPLDPDDFDPEASDPEDSDPEASDSGADGQPEDGDSEDGEPKG